VSCLAEQVKILVEEAEEDNLGVKVKRERWSRWYTCSLCEQNYHGVVQCALGWACWKTYLGRPEKDKTRGMAMTQLGNGLSVTNLQADALTVGEAELAMMRRIGDSEHNILITQGNLAITYQALGRLEDAILVDRDVYLGRLKLSGEEDENTMIAALNYAIDLRGLESSEEGKALFRKTMPVARRVLGESRVLTLKMRTTYARTLYENDGATLEDLHEAVITLEKTERAARRVLGSAHPFVGATEQSLRSVREVLRAREAPVA